MSKYYYKVDHDHGQLKAGCYWSNALSVTTDGTAVPHGMVTICSHSATRIWHEDDEGEIKIIKDRYQKYSEEIDTEEFMWVKLSAKKYVNQQ